MENIGKKLCPGNSRHINICYFFVKERFESNNTSISYCSTEHILIHFLTKSLQGDLFVKFGEVIMGWNHVDTLQMGPPSTNARYVNVVEIKSIKGEIRSSVETKEENTESKKS